MSGFFKFPKGFLWGSAVSGHQIEGGNRHSDWWHWELATPTQPFSGKAVDYWNRYEEDHQLLEELGHQAFRLGIEWARVEPKPNEFDVNVIEHYRRIFESLQRRKIKICLTLHHWVLPEWVAQKGGWSYSKTVDFFERYSRRMVDEFGDFPELWITFNEPMVAALAGYITADFPPQRHSFFGFRSAVRHMLEAHARVYRIIHESKEGARVGIAMAYPWIEPWGSKGVAGWYERLFVDVAKTWIYRAWDRSVQTGRVHPLFGFGKIEGLGGSVDFAGINYYFRVTPRASIRHIKRAFFDLEAIPKGICVSDMGWQIYPEGLYRVLMEVWGRFKKPIFITENGIADGTDAKRDAYIVSHLQQVYRAIEKQIPVQGYFHWSFIDNFEWNEGFSMKFGLVDVDFTDSELKRKPRRSATMYRKIIQKNGFFLSDHDNLFG